MSKINIKFELLDFFEEEEISTICKYIDINVFLTAIKEKRYEKYAKKLGRLDKRSQLVQKLLPGMAFLLYKKGEEPFREVVALALERYQHKFIKTITECMKPAISIQEIKLYNFEQVAEFYYNLQGVSSTHLPEDMFFVFLKLQGIIYTHEECLIIKKNIAQMKKYLELKEQYEKEKEAALEMQEKQLAIKHEQQLQELRKKADDYKGLYKKSQEKIQILEAELQKLQDTIQNKKDELQSLWHEQYNSELEQRKAADEYRFRKEQESAELRLHEKLMLLEDEYAQRKSDLEVKHQKNVSSLKLALEKELEDLKRKVGTITNQKFSLEEEVHILQNQVQSLSDRIKQLYEKENCYFETFEQRMINRKIDEIIFSRLKIEEKTSSVQLSIPNVISINNADICVISAKTITQNAEYGITVESLDDFFEDFKNNISLNFDHPTEIAAVVLSALLSGVSIIAENCVCQYVSTALSALIDLSTPLIVDISSGKADLKAVLNIINKANSQVIYVRGVLDNFDESMFAGIYSECEEKYIFFSICNIEDIKMLSKTLFNYAVVIDTENELHFTENENMLIGDHEISRFVPEFNLKKGQDVYKNIFNRLVLNKFLKKSTALCFCKIVQTYFSIISGDVLGDTLQRAIMIACDFSDADEDINDLLKKCGITNNIKYGE